MIDQGGVCQRNICNMVFSLPLSQWFWVVSCKLRSRFLWWGRVSLVIFEEIWGFVVYRVGHDPVMYIIGPWY